MSETKIIAVIALEIVVGTVLTFHGNDCQWLEHHLELR